MSVAFTREEDLEATAADLPDRPVEAALLWTDGPKLTPIPEALIRKALASMS